MGLQKQWTMATFIGSKKQHINVWDMVKAVKFTCPVS
jgi:hypothetical protein